MYRYGGSLTQTGNGWNQGAAGNGGGGGAGAASQQYGGGGASGVLSTIGSCSAESRCTP
jgi:hypothetical protein